MRREHQRRNSVADMDTLDACHNCQEGLSPPEDPCNVKGRYWMAEDARGPQEERLMCLLHVGSKACVCGFHPPFFPCSLLVEEWLRIIMVMLGG